MKTLKNVVELVIDSINMPVFSAYDITGLVRHHVEWSKSKEKFDITLSPPNSKHWYDIKHNDVRDIVIEMFESGKLTRKPTGNWYSYSVATPITSSPVPSPTPVTKQKTQNGNLSDLVYGYVTRKLPTKVTLKQVQSALKRHGNFTCKEISECKPKNLRFYINPSLSKSYFTK